MSLTAFALYYKSCFTWVWQMLLYIVITAVLHEWHLLLYIIITAVDMSMAAVALHYNSCFTWVW